MGMCSTCFNASECVVGGSGTGGGFVSSNSEILDSLFREAVSDIDAGDVTALERLLAAHPKLVRDRLDCPGAWLRDKVGGALVGFFEKPYLL